MKKTKIVELLIDEDEDLHGIQAISLVTEPAIQRDFVALNKDNFLSLAKVDEEKRILVGTALIPDKKIPRYDQEKQEEYLVYFSKETIEESTDANKNTADIEVSLVDGVASTTDFVPVGHVGRSQDPLKPPRSNF